MKIVKFMTFLYTRLALTNYRSNTKARNDRAISAHEQKRRKEIAKGNPDIGDWNDYKFSNTAYGATGAALTPKRSEQQ